MQPALVALQLALADLWQAWGITASAVIGHSLGEVAAAIHAGVMDLEAGLQLVVHRARLMQSTQPGAMLAIQASLAKVTGWLAGSELDVAAINGPEAIVVSGAIDGIGALAGKLDRLGVRTQLLAVSLASHSRLMAPMLPALRDALAGTELRAPRLPIIANLTGRPAGAGDYSADYWCRHVREPVRFADGVAGLRELDIDVLIELGPDHAMLRQITAAGLLPAGGGHASLRRGNNARTTMLAAHAAVLALDLAPRAEHGRAA
jgi:acyl transferase domain-containing protein